MMVLQIIARQGCIQYFSKVPYSGKCRREKTSANLAICYEFAKVLSANCLYYLKKL